MKYFIVLITTISMIVGYIWYCDNRHDNIITIRKHQIKIRAGILTNPNLDYMRESQSE